MWLRIERQDELEPSSVLACARAALNIRVLVFPCLERDSSCRGRRGWRVAGCGAGGDGLHMASWIEGSSALITTVHALENVIYAMPLLSGLV